MRKPGRPSHGLTPEEMKARHLKRSKESKDRKKELVKQLRLEGQPICRHHLCISLQTRGKYCDKHQVITRSKCIDCGGIPMPCEKRCGACDEAEEERQAALDRLNANFRNAEKRSAA